MEDKPQSLNYRVYEELAQFTTDAIEQRVINTSGQPAKALIEQSYQRLGLQLEGDDITFEQAMSLARNIGRFAALLVGPGRQQKLVEQMEERLKILYQK